MRYFILLVLSIPAYCGTFTAVTCNRSDVNAVINGPTHTAVTGDIINIPSGSCSWSSGVSISGICIQILGSGSPNSSGTTFGPGTISTTLTDTINDGATPLFGVQAIPYSGCNGSNSFRISTLTILPGGSVTNGFSPVTLSGSCTSSGCPNIRADNISFGNGSTQWVETTQGAPADWMIRADNVVGVLDHDTLPSGSGVELLNANLSSYLGTGAFGDNSWAQADTFGAVNVLYMENNIVFTQQAMNDCDTAPVGGSTGGCRVAARFNQFTFQSGAFAVVTVHGLDTGGRMRGGRQIEGYGNTVSCPTSSGCSGVVGFRSGTGFVFGNTITSTAGGFMPSAANMTVYRTVYADTPWGGCGGLNSLDPWDTNDNTVYVSGTMTSGTSGLVLADSTKTWTTNQWATSGSPYTIYDVTQGTGYIAEIASNTSNTITVQQPISESSWYNGGAGNFQVGDSYEIIRSTICADQGGRGAGVYVSGSSPSPSGPLSQALDPIYEWDDTTIAGSGGFGGFNQGNFATDTVRAIANRDWYTDSSNGSPTAQTSATSPFNGATGVGFGTLARRPTTCTAGVGYFATDQGSWNTSGNSFGSGVFYTCVSTNTWGTYYTPYTYPHPLTNSGTSTPTYMLIGGNHANAPVLARRIRPVRKSSAH